MDNNLNFENQCKSVLKKMAIGIKTITHISKVVPLKTRNLLLHSLVLSHFNYSCLLFTGLTQAYTDKLERSFSWGLKVCYQKRKHSSTTTLCMRSRLPPLKFQIKAKATLMFWKLQNSSWEAFKVLTFPNYNIKENSRTHKIYLQNPGKTKYLTHSFLNFAIKTWNTISMNPIDIKNYKKAKAHLKEYFMKEYELQPNDRRIGSSWQTH